MWAISPAADPHQQRRPHSYEQSWSFGIQQDVGWGTRLDLQYVGKKGTHLYFSGATQLDVLGPQVENYSQSQINSLVSQVQNPFVGIITDRTAPCHSRMCTDINWSFPICSSRM